MFGVGVKKSEILYPPPRRVLEVDTVPHIMARRTRPTIPERESRPLFAGSLFLNRLISWQAGDANLALGSKVYPPPRMKFFVGLKNLGGPETCKKRVLGINYQRQSLRNAIGPLRGKKFPKKIGKIIRGGGKIFKMPKFQNSF